MQGRIVVEKNRASEVVWPTGTKCTKVAILCNSLSMTHSKKKNKHGWLLACMVPFINEVHLWRHLLVISYSFMNLLTLIRYLGVCDNSNSWQFSNGKILKCKNNQGKTSVSYVNTMMTKSFWVMIHNAKRWQPADKGNIKHMLKPVIYVNCGGCVMCIQPKCGQGS